MKKLLIIPAYNEAKNILKVHSSIKELDEDIDYVFINDGSKDNTEQLCKEYNLNCVTLIQNLGIGGAVQTGYIYALKNNYDIAIQFDGDGQHEASYILKLCEEIENGNCDFSIGSRYIKGSQSEFKSTFMRRFGSTILSFLIKLVTGKKITDPTSGFRAANKKVIQIFANNYPTDYPEPESIVELSKMGIKIKDVPVVMHERKEGKSSITVFKSLYYMIKVSLAIFITGLSLPKKRGNK